MKTFKDLLNEKEKELNEIIKYLNVVEQYADEAIRYFNFGDTNQTKHNIRMIEKTIDKIKKSKDFKNL